MDGPYSQMNENIRCQDQRISLTVDNSRIVRQNCLYRILYGIVYIKFYIALSIEFVFLPRKNIQYFYSQKCAQNYSIQKTTRIYQHRICMEFFYIEIKQNFAIQKLWTRFNIENTLNLLQKKHILYRKNIANIYKKSMRFPEISIQP